jgi:hypothetical protein
MYFYSSFLIPHSSSLVFRLSSFIVHCLLLVVCCSLLVPHSSKSLYHSYVTYQLSHVITSDCIFALNNLYWISFIFRISIYSSKMRHETWDKGQEKRYRVIVSYFKPDKCITSKREPDRVDSYSMEVLRCNRVYQFRNGTHHH